MIWNGSPQLWTKSSIAIVNLLSAFGLGRLYNTFCIYWSLFWLLERFDYEILVVTSEGIRKGIPPEDCSLFSFLSDLCFSSDEATILLWDSSWFPITVYLSFERPRFWCSCSNIILYTWAYEVSVGSLQSLMSCFGTQFRWHISFVAFHPEKTLLHHLHLHFGLPSLTENFSIMTSSKTEVIICFCTTSGTMITSDSSSKLLLQSDIVIFCNNDICIKQDNNKLEYN
jgi:hypothetical protein